MNRNVSSYYKRKRKLILEINVQRNTYIYVSKLLIMKFIKNETKSEYSFKSFVTWNSKKKNVNVYSDGFKKF